MVAAKMSKSILLLIVLSIYLVNHTEADTQRPAKERRKNNVYREYGYWFTSTQCRMIERQEYKTFDQCKHLCNLHVFCTAFNWKYREACEVRACGKFPPYPIGRPVGLVVGWKGYSKYYIDSPGWYDGPYGQYWEGNRSPSDQGVAIGPDGETVGPGEGVHKGKTRVECENICDSMPECGGFNFNRANGNCVMKRFSTTIPALPRGKHYSLEAFSKIHFNSSPLENCDGTGEICINNGGRCKGTIKTTEGCRLCCVLDQTSPEPLWKCPSYRCKEENIPPGPYDRMSQYSQIRHYCKEYSTSFFPRSPDGCSCQSDLFCYFKCNKCKDYRKLNF